MNENEMLSIDLREINERVQEIINNAIPQHAADGLYKVGKQLLRDAVEIEPKVPIGHHRAKAGKRTGVGGALKRSGKVVKMQDGSVVVGFDMPYASYQHEGQRSDGTRVVQNYTEPGAGKEFLKKKVEQFSSVYMHLLANYIKGKSST
jgi:hypothetical protein